MANEQTNNQEIRPLYTADLDNFLLRDSISQDLTITPTNSQSIIYGGSVGFNQTSLNVLKTNENISSLNYVPGISGWQIKGNGDAEFSSITLSGGMLKYGKTSFSDNTNSGYYFGSDGMYVGAANDTSKLKYIIEDGTFDMIGTISGRSTVTLASAINDDGSLLTDVINARLNTQTKSILAGFNFGDTTYAGAVRTGDIAWDSSTGVLSSGTGVAIYRGGIVGANSGVATFSIDATTGAAMFAGTLSAASGTLGSVTLGSTGYIKGGQTDYGVGAGFYIGYSGDAYKMSIGNSTNYVNWDGDNLRIRGDLELTSVFNMAVYTVAALPAPPTAEGFNSPSATE